MLATKPQHFAGLEKTFNALRRDVDPDIELIDPSHIRDEIASDALRRLCSATARRCTWASSASASRSGVRAGTRVNTRPSRSSTG